MAGELIKPGQYRPNEFNVLSTASLISADGITIKPSNLFIASHTYVGAFNQIGLLVADFKPEGRPYMERHDSYPTYSPEQVDRLIKNGELTEQQRYFYDMTNGMAAIRLIGIPKPMMEIFEADKYLGRPMISKLCMEVNVPEEYAEIEIRDLSVGDPMRLWEYFDLGTLSTEMEQAIEPVVNPVKRMTGEKTFEYFGFVTFFPSARFVEVTGNLEAAVQEAIANFDEFGKRHQDLRVKIE